MTGTLRTVLRRIGAAAGAWWRRLSPAAMQIVHRWARALVDKLAGVVPRRWVDKLTGMASRRLVVAAVAVVGVTLLTAAATVAMGTSDAPKPVERTIGTWVEPDQYGAAPPCDGFSRETLATLGPLPASERQGTQDHAYCGWPYAANGFLYVMVNVLPADGTGATKAARWLAGEPGAPVKSPKIGDAAKLERHDAGCTLQFHRSNLMVRMGYVSDNGTDCGTRAVALAAEFASRLPRTT